VVPVVLDGALIAVLDLDSPSPDRFDEEDVAFCTELVQRLATRLGGVANRSTEG